MENLSLVITILEVVVGLFGLAMVKTIIDAFKGK
jgi:hypothetical protein